MRLVLMLLFLATSIQAGPDLRWVIWSIEAVESGGDTRAHNRKSGASGSLQIKPVTVRDVNRILGRNEYAMHDRWDRAEAYDLAEVYLGYYGWVHHSRTGRLPTVRDYARIWRAGPTGATRRTRESEAYAARVAALYDSR